jgi:hypothetical protein
MKAIMKTMFRAVINISGNVFTFTKSANTEMELLGLVKEAGISVADIVKIESFQVSTEKRRGKTARKY